MYKNAINNIITVKERNYVQTKFKSTFSLVERYKSTYYSNYKIICSSSKSGKEAYKTFTKIKFILDFLIQPLYNIHIKVITFNDRSINV
tara:strand:- start:3935 stop:4201 length:267 start_codon:yes stop_codon:yes gene_type:complete